MPASVATTTKIKHREVAHCPFFSGLGHTACLQRNSIPVVFISLQSYLSGEEELAK